MMYRAHVTHKDTAQSFVRDWRAAKCRAFDLERNSTAGRTVAFTIWGRPVEVYANANLSIYSANPCNADCPFCVEKIRPASRGVELSTQKEIEKDDGKYFEALEETLKALRPLNPSVSITGGEPSNDPRLPRILKIMKRANARKMTITTNGSGLLRKFEGRKIIDWITSCGIQHLNISRAHPDDKENARIMHLDSGLSRDELSEAVRIAKTHGTRTRLSCVLLRDTTDGLDKMFEYLSFAQSMGVDNVVFRQLMLTDAAASLAGGVVGYSDAFRVRLHPILEKISADGRFSFIRQVMGYYYYVEVWRYDGIDIVFEEADLTRLEETKRETPGVIQELVFHPNARLASTWQPWEGVLGPPSK
jgi:cyclic pyranopterin phosphate synthase